MRSVEDTNLTEKHHRHTASFSLTDFSAQFEKEQLNVSPLDIRAGWSREDELKSTLVPALHAAWYHSSVLMWQ